MAKNLSRLQGTNISYHYDPNAPVLRQVDFTVDATKIGLIGDNGSGKSTLLKIIAGKLKPTTGTISIGSKPYLMSQDKIPGDERTVAQILDIEQYFVAYDRLMKGEADVSDYAALEGNWSFASRIEKVRSSWFPSLPLDRRVSDISGGEYAAIGLAYIELHRPKIVLLDEPSNNLDLAHRQLLAKLLVDYTATIIIATHDRQLLRYVDSIWEIKAGNLTKIEGTYTDYLTMCSVRQSQAKQRLSSASKGIRRLNRAVTDLEKRQSRKRDNNRTAASQKRGSKMSMNGLKSRSEASLGRDRAKLLERKYDADVARVEAEKEIEKPRHIRLQGFLQTPHAKSQQILRLLDDTGWETIIGGDDRVALLGENGVGKSSLIRSISDLQYRNKLRAWAELVRPDNPSQIAILSQNSLHLCYEKSVWEELTSSLPEYEKQAVFTILARLSFDENSSNKLIKDLSGGERFRVALAEVLLSKPEKRLIILDEPTNSLDLASLKATEQMLSQFSGAILVVSHDLEFLQQISVNRWIELTNDGLFELVNPPDY